MRTRRAGNLVGYTLELAVSALRGARVVLGRMLGEDEDEHLRPPAAGGGPAQRSGRVSGARHAAPHDVPGALPSSGARDAAAPGASPPERRGPEALRRALETAPPLPASYGDDRLVILARDPGMLFAYWDLAPGFDRPTGGGAPRLVLRIDDLTLLDFAAARPWRHQDLEVDGLVGSRYVEVAQSAGTYRAQLGWRYGDGRFVARVQSATVTTPRADAPGHEPLRWMTVRSEGAGRGQAAGAQTQLAVEEAPAPRGAPTAALDVAALAREAVDPYGHVDSAATHDAPSSVNLHRRPPSSADLHGRAPSSADLHRRAPSSDATDAGAPHRRGG